jgi:hypothetical protein
MSESNNLEGDDPPAILGAALLQSNVSTISSAGERNHTALLPDRQGGEQDGKAILAPGRRAVF